ncbi:toprim domain-containing protein [Geomonas ferrireducens]|uniref:toprim domain-containing protein n=1 Tax=Geomonas ferrireducens TaxID=2570227 RepID=UPI0013A5D2A0|nr:toprim domain-containing protein [Geomonas ferrireducens]
MNATFGTYKKPGVIHRWQAGTDGSEFRYSPQVHPLEQLTVDHERIWTAAPPAQDKHPYLVRKGVSALGLRYHKGALLVPVRDIGGSLHGLQRIWPDGAKRFTPGTVKQGNFFLLGEIASREPVIICEGYATGATVHRATGNAVAIAFDAGNLLTVAQGIRAQFPDLPIIIAGDDDHATEDNPGAAMATEAARIVGGMLALPLFPGARGPKDSDFNDLAQKEGIEAVRLQLSGMGEATCSR